MTRHRYRTTETQLQPRTNDMLGALMRHLTTAKQGGEPRGARLVYPEPRKAPPGRFVLSPIARTFPTRTTARATRGISQTLLYNPGLARAEPIIPIRIPSFPKSATHQAILPPPRHLPCIRPQEQARTILPSRPSSRRKSNFAQAA